MKRFFIRVMAVDKISGIANTTSIDKNQIVLVFMDRFRERILKTVLFLGKNGGL
ncbi:hypothetical protein GF373_09140 [bacterium]|nr:hypothetical protein [bacterium]